MYIRNKKDLRRIISKANATDVNELAEYLYKHIEETRFTSYHNGYKQGEFEIATELIHDTNDEDRRQRITSIRDDILKVWANKSKTEYEKLIFSFGEKVLSALSWFEVWEAENVHGEEDNDLWNKRVTKDFEYLYKLYVDVYSEIMDLELKKDIK